MTARAGALSRFTAGFAGFTADLAVLGPEGRRPLVDFAAARPFALPFADLAGFRLAPAVFLCLVSLAMQYLLGESAGALALRMRPDRL